MHEYRGDTRDKYADRPPGEKEERQHKILAGYILRRIQQEKELTMKCDMPTSMNQIQYIPLYICHMVNKDKYTILWRQLLK